MSVSPPRLRLIAAVVFAVAVQLALTHVGAIESDEGLFGACAVRQIATAALPLTNCVDIKPPGIFLLYEAAYRLFGNYEPIGLRLIWIGLALALALGMRSWARRLGRDGDTAAALALLLLTTSNFFLALKSELPAIALACGAMALVRPTAWRLIVAGALIGVGTLFKQPIALMLLPRLIAARPHSLTDMRLWISRGALLAVGWAAPLAAASGLYALAGHWADFADQMWLRPALYAAHKTPGFAVGDALVRGATQLAPVLCIVALFVAASLLAKRRGPIAADPEIWTFLAAGLVIVSLGAHFFPSYAIVLIPPLALLIAGLPSPPDGARRGALFAGAGIALAVALAVMTVVRLRASETYTASLARRIDAAGSPGDALYVWGYVPELYPAVGRLPASRFVVTSMLFGYFHDSEARAPVNAGMRYVRPGDWTRFIGELERRPVLIVDTSVIRMGAPRNYPPEAFPMMRQFLQEHCQSKGSVNAFPVYHCLPALPATIPPAAR